MKFVRIGNAFKKLFAHDEHVYGDKYIIYSVDLGFLYILFVYKP